MRRTQPRRCTNHDNSQGIWHKRCLKHQAKTRLAKSTTTKTEMQTGSSGDKSKETASAYRNPRRAAVNYRYLRDLLLISGGADGFGVGEAWDGSVGDRSRLRHSVLDEGVHFFTSSSPALHLQFYIKKTPRALNRQHPDFPHLIVQYMRRSLGTAFADLAGLIRHTEGPQFALASGV